METALELVNGRGPLAITCTPPCYHGAARLLIRPLGPKGDLVQIEVVDGEGERQVIALVINDDRIAVEFEVRHQLVRT